MARVTRVAPRDAGVLTRLAYLMSRRAMRKMTARDPERMIEPIEVYAHAPRLLQGYGRMEQATAKIAALPSRYRHLAELKAATMTHCEYCIDISSQISRRSGLTDDELLAVANYRESPLFDELDNLVLDYAVGMSRTPAEVPGELFTRLRESFDEKQMVELTHVIAIENHRGRFNLAMGIGSAGFSEGMVCAVPAPNVPVPAGSHHGG